MIASFLIGAIAGMRSMTPLAAISLARGFDRLPDEDSVPALLGAPLVMAGTAALAAGELIGDKLASAPDRIIAPGIAARIVTGALAGAALAPRRQRNAAALLGAAVATGFAYLSFNARMRAMRRYSQTATGLIEDSFMLGATALLMHQATAARA